MVTKVGQRLPMVSVVDEAGRHVDIDTLRDGRAAVLFFMRAATCVMCLRHGRTLAAMADELSAAAVHPIIVVPGEASRVRRLLGPRVQVVSSVDRGAHESVGLGRTLLMQHSGTLLVGADGMVRYSRLAALPTGSFDKAELVEALARL